MFALRETTKIRICRAAFVVLCALPTAAVACWSMAIRLPAYRAAHERAIAGGTGWEARLKRVSTPRPGTTVYERVELFDPATRQRLAELARVEVRQSGSQVAIHLLDSAVINGDRLDAFWQLASDQVRHGAASWQLDLEASTLTLHRSDGDQSLADVAAHSQILPEQSRLVVGFRRDSPEIKGAPLAELGITRQGRPVAPVTTYTFSTGGGPLPCTMLRPLLPGVDRLGLSSTFDGTVAARQQAGQTSAELAGKLSGVDLASLLFGFPHRLTGVADVQFKQLRIEGGHVALASGKLSAGPGFISRSLIEAAQANLHLQATLAGIDGPAERQYEKLSLFFEAGPQGLSVRGADAQGAVIVDPQGEVLMQQTTAAKVPVVNLVRALVPQSNVQVPATRETAPLVSWLPVPSLSPPRGESPPLKARLQSAPLRK